MPARVTLTFDNGPTPGVTERVLDVLGERGLRTTFFVVGDRLRDPATRALAERAHDEGHAVGNHTLTHTVPLGALDDAGEVGREIDEAQALIGDLAGGEKLFRPYGQGGVIDGRLVGKAGAAHLSGGGFTCVLWDEVPHDGDDPEGWVDRVLDGVQRRPWSVVVLHDVRRAALPRLPELLDRLAGDGVEVVGELPDHVLALDRGRPGPAYAQLGLGAFPSESAPDRT